MMKFLIALSFTITALTAVAFWPQTCEERGMKVETLEPVGSNRPTEVCVPNIIEVTQVAY